MQGCKSTRVSQSLFTCWPTFPSLLAFLWLLLSKRLGTTMSCLCSRMWRRVWRSWAWTGGSRRHWFNRILEFIRKFCSIDGLRITDSTVQTRREYLFAFVCSPRRKGNVKGSLHNRLCEDYLWHNERQTREEREKKRTKQMWAVLLFLEKYLHICSDE